MSHSNLQNYYKTLYGLKKHHNYDMEYVENLMVYEKDIFVTMILEDKDKEG